VPATCRHPWEKRALPAMPAAVTLAFGRILAPFDGTLL
jgi:hypothetical protein